MTVNTFAGLSKPMPPIIGRGSTMPLSTILVLLLLRFSLCEAGSSGVLATVLSHDNAYDEPRKDLQNNYGGWVNPEDLPSMPQCIAQQDPSAWLEVMTRCISKGCTRHFGIICTHHQWLARLDCLRTEFTTDVIKQYSSLCSRSILAKAQLFSWINTITGRTWLVEVGDSPEMNNISPQSLPKGYMNYDVVNEAPSCLGASSSFATTEGFERIASWCTFTGHTEHTGNAARPWEYNERAGLMVALDSVTAGYDQTDREIADGLYIDKACLCTSYTIDTRREPCRDPVQPLDQTRERLWMMATCGFDSIPKTWAEDLRTIGDAFILTEDWSWPTIIASTPQRAKRLMDKCLMDACEVDERGYCRIQNAVDKACICRDLNYSLCGKSCDAFETRIAYVNWLHQVCGTVDRWHGLPEDWKQLAQPLPLDMIPWHRPVITPANDNRLPYNTFMLLNLLATVVIFGGYTNGSLASLVHSSDLLPRHWFSRGTSIAGFQLLVCWVNSLLVQSAAGDVEMSVPEMVLLGCTIPRLAWIPVLLIGVQPMEMVDLTAAASALWAEAVLQAFSSYHLLMTIAYGVEHSFYFGRLAEVDNGGFAQLMYWSALMWLIVVGLTALRCMRIDRSFLRRWHKVDWFSKGCEEGCLIWADERCAWIDEQFAYYCMGRFKGIYHAQNHHGGYGSVNNVAVLATNNPAITSSLYVVVITGMIFLWVSQLLFWTGLVGTTLAMR